MCEQVSVGVCDWGWFAPAESHHRWAISVPVTLSPLSDPCSVCGRRLRSVLVPQFLSPAASWTPIAGPWLPIASLRYPPQPYGKLRICLRKAPFLPTEAPPLPYGKLRICLRKAPFSFSLCITSVINSFSATESSRLHCDTYMLKNSIYLNQFTVKSMLPPSHLPFFSDTALTWKLWAQRKSSHSILESHTNSLL